MKPSVRPSDKVTAATTAATVSGALGTFVIWLLEKYWTEIPDPVEAAIIVLLTLACTFAAGYFVPEGHPAPSAKRTVRRERERQARAG